MTRLLRFCIGILVLIFICVHNAYGAAVMSVDFGSESMKVGVVSPGVPMEIALNKESKRKTPAVIAFRDGVRTFGEDAQSTGVRFPSNTYFYLLDLLGKTVDNPIVQLYKERFPYYEIVGDKNRNTVVFKSGDQMFRVEELVAQLLVIAREFAETTTNQPVTECVLIVPGYFGQAERTALLTAAQLANLKVLQLINDYTAVALNYGVFRRKEINETAQYYIFYDMGAQKTSAALVSYQMVKDKATKETNPVIQILGVGYDRTLGGLEIQLRLRDYLAQEFNKMKKTKTDVFTNNRAMAKLFKEAQRLKNVLSANMDHYAQIENLLEDIDFKFQVTREKLEEICSDLWPRVAKPLEQALQMAGLSLDVVNQVILFGGGTRVPKVQEILRDAIKQELGKNLNADEAATMGAVYKAADLATGFKVKKFIIKDGVLFPIQVTFDREGDSGNTKKIKRTLFSLMNSYPQKKVITFNKYVDDFDFYVNYADLNHLKPEEISYIGGLNISHVELKGVKEILEKHKEENVESKGIKAHFTLDDSGVFSLTGVDFVFEKQQVGETDDEGTLSKLGSTISKLFSGNKSAQDATNQTETDETVKQNETESNQNKTEKSGSDAGESGKNETIKIVNIKEPVTYVFTELYTTPLSADAYDESFKKLEEINTAEYNRARRESAFNALESFVIEAQEKLGNNEYSKCATEDEKNKVLEECSAVSEWLYNEGENADADMYEKRLMDLRKLTNDIYARHWEHEERPDALKALDGMIDGAVKFLQNAKTLTKESNPEKDVFTQVEIDTLKNVIDETIEWKKSEIKEQNKLKLYENVRLTVKEISDKMGLLDREVKYLINKLKIWRPKKPVQKDKSENDQTKSNNTTENDNVKEDNSNNSETKDDKDDSTEGPDLKMNEKPIKQEEEIVTEKSVDENERDTKTSTPHGEL